MENQRYLQIVELLFEAHFNDDPLEMDFQNKT